MLRKLFADGSSKAGELILMTASAGGPGLLPLARDSGEAGREIGGLRAVVIPGGMMTSTRLSLLVLPTLALRYGRSEKSPAANE